MLYEVPSVDVCLTSFFSPLEEGFLIAVEQSMDLLERVEAWLEVSF